MKKYLMTEKQLRESWSVSECFDEDEFVDYHFVRELPSDARVLTREEVEAVFDFATQDYPYSGPSWRRMQMFKKVKLDELFGEKP